MSFDEGTLFEPLAVVLHSLKFADVRLGDTVVVFGAGPIGLLTIAVLKLSGAARVWAVEPVAHRREMAQAVGADEVLDYENAVPEITRATGGRGADATIDCAAKGGSVNASLHVTRNAGRVVYTAIPSEVRVDLEFHVARRKEIAIFNVRRSNHESELAVALMREHMPRLAPILTHRVPLERIQEGFAMLERYEDGVGKLIIRV
jgi:L-iditol 2-dehydrogenase